VKYEIVSDRPCFIDGLGELKPGETLELNDEQLRLFEFYHGVQLKDANFPPDVIVTTVLAQQEDRDA